MNVLIVTSFMDSPVDLHSVGGILLAVIVFVGSAAVSGIVTFVVTTKILEFLFGKC